MNIQQFQDTLQIFSTASSVDEITELCRFHCQNLGFDNFVYALRIPTKFSEARVIIIKGYPDLWLERYWELGYHASDPVIAYCSQHVVPIQWHDLLLDKSSLSALVMNEAAEFGLRAGISMPMHSPRGELGILSFALNQQRRSAARAISQHAMPYVQLLGGYVHEAVCRVFGVVDPEDKLPLTLREQECLRWAADGKTSWEISQLLKLSERTINFHLNNAMIKLDVSTRQHAIAKAVLRGLITPYPF
jgi:DNA-binding CsgD family transcriptional regulator